MVFSDIPSGKKLHKLKLKFVTDRLGYNAYWSRYWYVNVHLRLNGSIYYIIYVVGKFKYLIRLHPFSVEIGVSATSTTSPSSIDTTSSSITLTSAGPALASSSAQTVSSLSYTTTVR